MAQPVDFQNIVDAYAKAIDAAEIAGLKMYEALIKKRVHNRGEKSSGELIGGYSKAWAKRRKNHPKAARQVSYVDLEFDGDLRKDTVIGKASDNNANVLGFKTELATDKATGNEARFGGPIFSPSKEETDEAIQSYKDTLDRKLKDALR